MTTHSQPPHATAVKELQSVDNAMVAQHRLIQSCQGLVRNIAWKIHRKLPASVELDDLIAYGQVGLAQAAMAYEEGRGQFTTYAYHRIRGSILDGLSQMAWFSKADFYAERYAQRAHDVLELDATESIDSHGTEVRDEVTWFSQLTASLSISYLASSKGGANEAACVATSSSPMAEAIDRELAEQLWKMVDILPGEGGALIRASYCEGLSLTEIAKRLGISKAWVSRLHTKTLQRLARALRQANAERS